METKRFGIYINRTGELIGELDSWQVAHRLAHWYLGEWPELAPLAVSDRARGTVRFVETGECHPLDCDVITLIPYHVPAASTELPPNLSDFLRHVHRN